MRNAIELKFISTGWEVVDDGCWNWRGGQDRDGYGLVRAVKLQMAVHRVAYEVWVGPIPEGLYVLHSCDNPPCVNPAHLRVGTQADNMRDMSLRGRSLTGERGKNAKISAGDVVEIRRQHEGGRSQASLSREYGLSTTQVNMIVLRKQWTTV